MSKIALSPNASGTGVFTIASPNGNTDRTLTLPDEAGTVLTDASNLASLLTSGSLPLSVLSNSFAPNGYMDIGNMRINWLTLTTSATANTGAAPGPSYTVNNVVSYVAAFKSGTKPLVMSTLVSDYHDVSHPGVSSNNHNNTQVQYLFSCYRAAGLQSRQVHIVAIGEKP